MGMPKASEEDKERFRRAMPEHPDVVVKPMFGNLGAFINGNMFAGLFGPVIGVKLTPDDKAELQSTEATVPFGPESRPLRDYTGLPEQWQKGSDDRQTSFWVQRAFDSVLSMPPKGPIAGKAKR